MAARGLDYLADLYVEINSAAKQVAVLEEELKAAPAQNDPSKRDEINKRLAAIRPEAEARDTQARVLFKKLEDGNPELKLLWEKFRVVTLRCFKSLRPPASNSVRRRRLLYEPMLRPLLAELKDKGIAVESPARRHPMDDPPKPGRAERACRLLSRARATT